MEQQFVEKEGLCLQAKFLEKYVTSDGQKEYWVYGITIQQPTGDVIKEGVTGDTGLFYSMIEKQEYFKAGMKVKYQYKRNDKEPKKSRIRPIVGEQAKTINEVQKSSERAKNTLKASSAKMIDYAKLKEVDAISFSASYAKDIIVSGQIKEKTFSDIADEIYKWQVNKYKEIK
jgi:hypothetical protein